MTMKKQFQSRLEAIDWIAEYAQNEGHFEVLRENLNFNFIYTGLYFVNLEEDQGEVVSLDKASYLG